MRDRALKVAEDLLGTAKDLAEVATEEELDNTVFTSTLDEQAALCNSCGWWVEADEVDDNGNCEECQE